MKKKQFLPIACGEIKCVKPVANKMKTKEYMTQATNCKANEKANSSYNHSLAENRKKKTFSDYFYFKQ